jgi:geranylgeranyl reductase family protein
MNLNLSLQEQAMENCDVLIVGGGPAGSSCAWQLRKNGMDVMVMDKALFPRDKVCAGWITLAVVDALQLDTEDYGKQHVLQPISSFRTGLIDGRDVETQYPGTVSYGIRRYELDDYLLQRSGARLQLGQPLKTLVKDGTQWIVNDAIATPLVIGAGGHFCPVARYMGAQLGADEPAITAKEIEFEMSPLQHFDCQVRGDTPEIYFCQDLKGYGWCFRKGNYLNIGLGREGGHKLSEHLKYFCDFLKQRGRIPEDIPDHFHGHAYLLHGHAMRKQVDDGMLLVGDAAGLAYPQSGEGILPAVESGLMAATTIIEAAGDYSRAQLQHYSDRLTGRFGAVASSGGIAPQFLRNFIAGRLLESKWFTRHVVLDRWFLHTRQASLNAGLAAETLR